MPAGKRSLISYEDAMAIAQKLLEATKASSIDAIAFVNDELKKHGLCYGSNGLTLQPADYIAGDIVHFAKPLDRKRSR